MRENFYDVKVGDVIKGITSNRPGAGVVYYMRVEQIWKNEEYISEENPEGITEYCGECLTPSDGKSFMTHVSENGFLAAYEAKNVSLGYSVSREENNLYKQLKDVSIRGEQRKEIMEKWKREGCPVMAGEGNLLMFLHGDEDVKIESQPIPYDISKYDINAFYKKDLGEIFDLGLVDTDKVWEDMSARENYIRNFLEHEKILVTPEAPEVLVESSVESSLEEMEEER